MILTHLVMFSFLNGAGVIVGAPFYVDRFQAFMAGAETVQGYLAGSDQTQAFVAGADAFQSSPN